MSKMIALALFAGGAVLVLLGIVTYDSASSAVPAELTNSAIGGPLLLIVGGAVAAGGLAGLARNFRGYSSAFHRSTDNMV